MALKQKKYYYTYGEIQEKRNTDYQKPGHIGIGRIAEVSILFFLSLLLMYIVISEPQAGTSMGMICDVMRGLGGSLCYVLALVPGLIGGQQLIAIHKKVAPSGKVIFDILILLALFASVHVFYVRRIMVERMTIFGFSNFVGKSYGYGVGGGAIGALLAWPLYCYCGEAGGLLVSVVIIIVCFVLTGRVRKLVKASSCDVENKPQPGNSVQSYDVFKTKLQEWKQKRDEGFINAASRTDNIPMTEKVPGQLSVDKKNEINNSHLEGSEQKAMPVESIEVQQYQNEIEPLFDDFDDFEPLPAQETLKDADHTPFDIPFRRKVKKEELPKIRREDMMLEMNDIVLEYNYPPIDLLQSGETEDVSKYAPWDREKAQLLADVLESFGVQAKLTGITHGPAVTRFELQPAPGTKMARITSLTDEIALNLAATSIRIEAPIPSKAAVGVEIPNDKVEMVRLRDVLESQEAQKQRSCIAVGLGKDNTGRYIVADIAKMPHVLIAGQTGSGKSVCINSIIASILFRASPEEVRLILIDPKVVELSIYNEIPHLVCPVVTDPKKAVAALDWAVAEMTKRYHMFAKKGVRDIKGYNKALEPGDKAMPQMVIIIDELADLMMVSPGEVEDSICRITQFSRACGIHMVISTQRPNNNVITETIKGNIPTRIAFSMMNEKDSRVIINQSGAEKLLGNGDMLFVQYGGEPIRVQGAWVTDEEEHAIVEYIMQSGTVEYDLDMLEHMENAVKSDAEKEEFAEEYDPKLPEAVDIVLEVGQASISMLQRRMRIGYARAGRIIDEMARRGIVSEAEGAAPRTVLMTREQINELFEDEYED